MKSFMYRAWSPKSLPSRERGLKSRNTIGICEISSSLPSRERGLKSKVKAYATGGFMVAPFAGAWIEMYNVYMDIDTEEVAPFAGAWIEISH